MTDLNHLTQIVDIILSKGISHLAKDEILPESIQNNEFILALLNLLKGISYLHSKTSSLFSFSGN